MSPARLNVFQRLARTWETVHPYNAGQACRVGGTFDAESIDRAWTVCTRAFGTSDGVERLDPTDDLSRLFTRELNRPFDRFPFRPFMQCVGDSTWFGVVYQHWVADSFSIRQLMCDWIGRLIEPGNLSRIDQKTSLANVVVNANSILSLIRRYGDYRRVRKIHTMGPLDYPVRVRLPGSLAGVVPPLLTYARSRQVKLNDVFVAALAEACNGLVPAQHRPGRRDLAVSSVVNLRPWLSGNAARNAFGCHLGFTGVVCPARDLANWNKLVHAVASQHRAQRHPDFGPPGVLWMNAAEIASKFTPAGRMYDFYRKEAPFAGGISNVNLTGSWFAENHPARVHEYIRVSPTGPMVPLAMNVTSLGDDLSLSMTYRTALFNDWTAAEIAQMFVGRLMRLASGNV